MAMPGLQRGKYMRFIVTSALLVLGAGAALAQTGSTTPGPTKPMPGAAAPAKSGPTVSGPAARMGGKTSVEEAKAECMRMWDAGTHMTKREWSSTCDRIQTRLDNLKIENLDVMGTGTGMRKKDGSGRQGSIDSPSRMD
jgi:hypothetical protein